MNLVKKIVNFSVRLVQIFLQVLLLWIICCVVENSRRITSRDPCIAASKFAAKLNPGYDPKLISVESIGTSGADAISIPGPETTYKAMYKGKSFATVSVWKVLCFGFEPGNYTRTSCLKP